MTEINILSLFDGISCGRVALDRAEIKYNHYFASEIDKYAIKIAQKNYPDTIQLGDITKWKEWNLPHIDLLIGGSPCQGFSNAGHGLNFDDPRSKLFFEFVNILHYHKSRYFLLENVRPRKPEWTKIISSYLEVEPVVINSALVSAQNRLRYYWTNITNITQPEDKHILLKDIIENGIVDRDKSYCIDANYWKGASWENYKEKSRRQLVLNQSIQIGSLYKNNADAGRIYSTSGKARTLKSESGGMGGKMGLYEDQEQIRKLTPIECEKLQTLPDNYTEGISNTQRYKCLGNGWTVDVIAHIFSFLPDNYRIDS